MAQLMATFMLALLVCAIVGCQSFTVDLIRRDSSISPFYNSSQTSFSRLDDAIQRSVYRAQRINLATTAAADHKLSYDDVSFSQKSQLVPGGGEYLLDITIGTPAVKVVAIADTGSDLTWTQCAPCKSCFKQTAALFDPRKSSTYRAVPCQSTLCTRFDFTTCSRAGCQYSMSYGDQSSTSGTLSADTIQIGTAGGSDLSLAGAIFGCGFDNAGTFSDSSAGIVGLGQGSSSLVSQMESMIGGRFSYCLLPLGSSGASKMNFGPDAVVTGAGSVSTPMVNRSDISSTFYALTLQSFSVGGQSLGSNARRTQQTESVEQGNIIIDSGTTLTLLPSDMYADLESAVKKSISLEPINAVGSLKLCYSASTDFTPPYITAHFDGADVTLTSLNTFVKVSSDAVCFTFIPTDGTAIWGNLAQMNFLVGYDLNQKTVSFKPADCSKL